MNFPLLELTEHETNQQFSQLPAITLNFRFRRDPAVSSKSTNDQKTVDALKWAEWIPCNHFK